ncbi:zinc finger CCCH-type with G patch domain-containing protein-like [Montipora foliosa]|uniref:zinc finger CCCH-type with G patch domain-containing protein-like n=1 Tax=Montipora foliosa TaxID=591990 RepID=UPI0035F1EE9C
MDEELLQKNLEQYKEQFLQIQAVLQSTGDEGQDDLVKLRDDLVELIHVSEESLLSLKKSKLLQLLEQEEDTFCDSPSRDNESYDLNNHDERDSLDNEDSLNIEDDITGMKCRISYTQDWGATEHHNAMVFDLESIELPDGMEETKVRVLFMNPTHQSMMPCPYFLESKCRFSENTCRYSHGYLVSVEDLMPFKEPDFSQVQCGQLCLARYDDGVWYKATIQSIDQDSHSFVVHYNTYNSDATLGLDGILPLDQRESENVSDNDLSSSSSDNEDIHSINENNDEENAVVRLSWKPSTGPFRLGEWEEHTKGIGSKLMVKMGYIFGKGLGKDGSGIVEPVEAVVLPQGKSLDKIAQLRENNKLCKPGKKKRKKTPQVKNIKLPDKASGGDIFDFINTKLGHKRGNIHDIRVPVPGTSAREFEETETGKKKKGEDKSINWNLQLFKTQEEISVVKKQLKKEETALSRHVDKDEKAASHFRQKVTAMKAHLSQLQEKEKGIQQKLTHRKNHRKLTVF